MGLLISFPAANGNNPNEKRLYELRTKCREIFRRFRAVETFTSKLDEMSKFQRVVREYLIVAECKVDEVRTCVMAVLRHRAQAMICNVEAAERGKIAANQYRRRRAANRMSAKSQRKNNDTVLAFSPPKS